MDNNNNNTNLISGKGRKVSKTQKKNVSKKAVKKAKKTKKSLNGMKPNLELKISELRSDKDSESLAPHESRLYYNNHNNV